LSGRFYGNEKFVSSIKNSNKSKFLAALRIGEAQADRGEVVPHEQVKLEFRQGFGDYTNERHGWLHDKSVRAVAKRIRARRSVP
jgi:hypothetical protein